MTAMDTLLSFTDQILQQLLVAVQAAGAAVASVLATWPTAVTAALVGAGVAASAAAIFFLIHRTRQARRTTASRSRAIPATGIPRHTTPSMRPRRPTPRGASLTPTGDTERIRVLVRRGVPAFEIARSTGLSHDAISLLLSQAAEKVRQGRPVPAGLSAPASPPMRAFATENAT